jgi:hypothetical protein
MKLKPYFYKQKIEDTHTDFGVVSRSQEKCPIGVVKLMGCACSFHSCCKGHPPHIRIVEPPYCWIECEATTKAMEEDLSLGQIETCIIQ